MKTMKLADWCEKTGVKYLTAWRWFKSDKMPVYAYQTDSGTILVEDDSVETNNEQGINTNDVMSIFLKKTVEFSKNNSTVEDFAAFILSNFSLKLNGESESSPKYSKNKPKTEDVAKHFAKFIPEKNSIEYLKMIKASLKDNPNGNSDGVGAKFLADDLNEDLQKALMNDSDLLKSVDPNEQNTLGSLNLLYNDAIEHPYSPVVEGVVTRNVEFVSTPQQTNYTGSTVTTSFGGLSPTAASVIPTYNNTILGGLTSMPQPDRRLSGAPASLPKRRGRKPSKKSGSNQ